jgi:Tc5 transposase DNA-binding domain
MPNSNTDIDELVDRAVREICAEREDGERVNVAAKAREIGVHKDRLYRRLKGVGPRTTRKPINSKLSVVQEASLMRYILCLDDIGQAVRYDWISHVANAILAEDHTDDDLPPSVGSHWARRFLNRHPELHKARQKPLELERALSELALSSCQSFRQLGYGFLPSRGIRCEYSSRTRKPNEIHRGRAGKTRAFRT